MTDERTAKSINEELMILDDKFESQRLSIKKINAEIEFIKDRIGWLPDLTQIPAYKDLLKENGRLSEKLDAIKKQVGGK